MPSYKLFYFDFRGRGELCRMLFALAGQEYEDVRIKRSNWDAEKKQNSYLFERLPVLEIDGKQYAQSMALASFLARQFGLHGKSDYEILEIDQVLGITQDIFNAVLHVFFEKDEKRKAEFTKENNEKHFPRFVGFLETVLKNNKTGFYVGNKLGFADVAAFEMLERVDDSILQRFPLVKANIDKVRANERIAQWLAKRPITEI